jgi:hypothetical protein
MVVAIDDLPPLLWHAEIGRSLPDVWTGERQRGVQLHRLGEAVTHWNERYGQRAWVRALRGTVEREHEDRLMKVVDGFDGRAFPTSLGLVSGWIRGRFAGSCSLETVSCAELVATTCGRWACFPSQRPARWYDPGRFWSGDRIELVPQFALDGEIAVR